MSIWTDDNNSRLHIKERWESWGDHCESTDIGNYVTYCGLSMATFDWKEHFDRNDPDSNLLGSGEMCEECLKCLDDKMNYLNTQIKKYSALREKYSKNKHK